jgi:hypothetical protein
MINQLICQNLVGISVDFLNNGYDKVEQESAKAIDHGVDHSLDDDQHIDSAKDVNHGLGHAPDDDQHIESAKLLIMVLVML